MRLQLILLGGVWPGLTHAGGDAAVRIDAYHNGWMEVVLPAMEAGYDGEVVNVDARYSVDILSGATQVMVTDTITAATTYSEVRQAGDLVVEVHPQETWSVSVAYAHAGEPDYQVDSGSVGGSLDLFERMSTCSPTYSFTLERVGRTGSTFAERRSTHRIDLDWAQILDPYTTLTFMGTVSTAFCGEELGCLANAYRYVPVSSEDEVVASLPERTPDRLTRGAVGARVARALGLNTALHASYRFYADTWKVTGHTLDSHLSRSTLDDRLVLRAQVRLSHQSAASFYRDDYVTTTDALIPVEDDLGLPAYRTGDRELSGFDAVLLGGRAQWTFLGVGAFYELSLNARVTGVFFRYPDFSELPARRASIIGGGMGARF